MEIKATTREKHSFSLWFFKRGMGVEGKVAVAGRISQIIFQHKRIHSRSAISQSGGRWGRHPHLQEYAQNQLSQPAIKPCLQAPYDHQRQWYKSVRSKPLSNPAQRGRLQAIYTNKGCPFEEQNAEKSKALCSHWELSRCVTMTSRQHLSSQLKETPSRCSTSVVKRRGFR